MSPERAKAWSNALGLHSSQLNREDSRTVPTTSSGYSAEELLRHKNFDAMTWQETEQVRRLLEQAPWRMAERRTRRLRAALRYARETPLVRALLSLQAVSMLFVAIPIPVEVVLADHTLHGGAGSPVRAEL